MASIAIVWRTCAIKKVHDKVAPNFSILTGKIMTQSNGYKQVETAQQAWANGLIAIGNAYKAGQDYQQVAADMIKTLYGYNQDDGIVLFKPTKASINPFRPNFDSALSYFVGNNPAFAEDQGFALAPWTNIVFTNHAIYQHHEMLIAMGQYTFTDTHGKNTLVDYTFGYRQTSPDQLKIVLHHSSLPFNPKTGS